MSYLKRSSILLTACLAAMVHAASQPHDIMPAPAQFRLTEGRLAIDEAFTFLVAGHDDARLRDGVSHALRRWEQRTGLTFAREEAANAAVATLIIDCAGPGNAIPGLGDDESYSIEIASNQAVLRAPAVVGVLRGLETLLQLLASDAAGWFVPAVNVDDAPRFPWRGLLVDVCRHWQPMDVIKRTLDGMALAKLNVLHLHLTEDQGFRIESRRYPRLHELGSDGLFYTQDEIREIIAYAAARGVRVVPEFDIPGHATSWLVGHPELASQPGPYSIERKWGIFDPALDPTNEAVYELLDGFLGEMAALFPDPFVHIGGDEVNGRHWDANPRIQAFIQENNLKDNAGLQTYFNRRVQSILAKHDKRMIGWDEILQPDLPPDAVIQSWRGAEALAAAAQQGYSGILSNGYYIDLSHPASQHYLVDPLPPDTPLGSEAQQRVLGGEATMWSEWVTPETIDSRIWPRTAAIAERLWSPGSFRDVDDMYRRLAVVSFRLEELGLALTRHVDPMLRRLAGDHATEAEVRALRVLADLVEPVKGYQRGRQQPDTTQFTPLTGLVDCARPDSQPARLFNAQVNQVIFASGEGFDELERALANWRATADDLREGLATRAPRVHALMPLLERVSTACNVGAGALDALQRGQPPPEAWRDEKLAELSRAGEPHDACELPIMPALRLLVVAASAQSERATMTPEQWRAHVAALAGADEPEPTTPEH